MDDRFLVPQPVSPSPYWHVREWQLAAVARRHGPSASGLRITFEHITEKQDAIQVIVLVERGQSLDTLLPFLDAARDLPPGIRIEAHTLESVPWDVIKPPRRWSVHNDELPEG